MDDYYRDGYTEEQKSHCCMSLFLSNINYYLAYLWMCKVPLGTDCGFPKMTNGHNCTRSLPVLMWRCQKFKQGSIPEPYRVNTHDRARCRRSLDGAKNCVNISSTASTVFAIIIVVVVEIDLQVSTGSHVVAILSFPKLNGFVIVGISIALIQSHHTKL
jgi:hypothetical protein